MAHPSYTPGLEGCAKMVTRQSCSGNDHHFYEAAKHKKLSSAPATKSTLKRTFYASALCPVIATEEARAARAGRGAPKWPGPFFAKANQAHAHSIHNDFCGVSYKKLPPAEFTIWALPENIRLLVPTAMLRKLQ